MRDFLATYAAEPARLVKTTAGAVARRRDTGLGGLDARPAADVRPHRAGEIDTADGAFEVTPLGSPLPVALLGSAQAGAAARRALDRFAHETAYDSWLRGQEAEQLAGALCAGDNVPTASGASDLAALAPSSPT